METVWFVAGSWRHALVGGAVGWIAAALRFGQARDRDAADCLARITAERQRRGAPSRTPPAPPTACPKEPSPIRVLVVRERGDAEWLDERARRN